ncbi:MAG: SPOR domain-containing protein, partial [Sphingobium sp.]
PAAGGWRVQLGAFGEESRARALWGELSRKVGGLAAYQPYLVKAGPVTRLQAGPVASSEAATRLCGAVKAAGADCMPKKM